jgi:hypothetical protein
MNAGEARPGDAVRCNELGEGAGRGKSRPGIVLGALAAIEPNVLVAQGTTQNPPESVDAMLVERHSDDGDELHLSKNTWFRADAAGLQRERALKRVGRVELRLVIQLRILVNSHRLRIKAPLFYFDE